MPRPLINPHIITHIGQISEDELRARLVAEALDQAGWLDPAGKPLKGVTHTIYRGDGRQGGYKLTITRDLSKSDQPRLTKAGE